MRNGDKFDGAVFRDADTDAPAIQAACQFIGYFSRRCPERSLLARSCKHIHRKGGALQSRRVLFGLPPPKQGLQPPDAP